MRNKFLNLASCVLLLSVTVSCVSAGDKPEELRIRIANRSGQDFDQVEVTFPSGKIDYGRVADGGVSAYRRVETAYRYALVEVSAAGKSLAYQPQDYMGEEVLEPGDYTYALKIGDRGDNLVIELVPE